MRALCLLSYRATRSAFDNFPCLIKFVNESARKHAVADETCTLMLATRVRTPQLDNWQAKVTWEENGPARPDPARPAGLLGHMVSHSLVRTALHGYSYQFPQARAASARAHKLHTRAANGTRMMHVQKPIYILTARGPVIHLSLHVTTTSRNGHFKRAQDHR